MLQGLKISTRLETCVNLQVNLLIPERRTPKVIQEVTNNVFGQDWILEKRFRKGFSDVLPCRQTLKTFVEDYTLLTLKNFGGKNCQ